MQRSKHNIVVFTGAGISAAAGLRTYRGPNGLWSDSEIVKASQASYIKVNPRFCWDHWGGLRAQIDSTTPTASHRALAAAQARLLADFSSADSGARVTLEGQAKFDGEHSLHIVTQNVDGMHGSALAAQLGISPGALSNAANRHGQSSARDVAGIIEFHGNVFQTRCANERCLFPPYEDHDPHHDAVPLCPLCGSVLRPGIVLFGEQIDTAETNKIQTARRLLRTAGTVIVVGTTLEVQPAKQVVDIKKRFYSGVDTVWVNLESAGALSTFFRKRYLAAADQVLPELLEKLMPA